MLQLVPNGWLGWNFDVLDNGDKIAEIKTSSLPDSGTFLLDGGDLRACREGLFSGDYFLESGGQRVARAQKPSAFRSSFEITEADKIYTLKKESLVGRSFVLLQGDIAVGAIRSEGYFGRKASVSMPEVMSLPVQLFIIWLTILLWKRESDSAAAVSASVAASS